MNLDEIIQQYNSTIKTAEEFSSPARDTKLQLEQCEILENLIYYALLNKKKAIEHADENVANLFLGYQCAAGAVLSEIRMWILLKFDKPNEAWDQYVAAQMALMDACRAHEGFQHGGEISLRLTTIEQLIFPKQSFVSAGFTAKQQICSICNLKYSTCIHLRHKAYWGELCDILHYGITGDHLALVDFPADRRCRIVSINTAEGVQDKLSLIVTPHEDDNATHDDASLVVQATMMCNDRFPYLQPSKLVLGELPMERL